MVMDIIKDYWMVALFAVLVIFFFLKRVLSVDNIVIEENQNNDENIDENISINKLNQEVFGMNEIDEYKRTVRILLVDNNVKVWDGMRQLSTNRGFNIYYRKDISFLHEVEPYDIAIIDREDVATEYSGQDGGLSFAVDAQKRYPQKKFIIYSGHLLNERMVKSIGSEIEYIEKTKSIDAWDAILNEKMKQLLDRKEQSEKIPQSNMIRLNDAEKTEVTDAIGRYHKTYDLNKLVTDLSGAVRDSKAVLSLFSEVTKK